jgi:UbiD family decarboxylase
MKVEGDTLSVMAMEFRDFLGGTLKAGTPDSVDPYLEASAVSRSDQGMPWIARAKGHPGWRLAGNVVSTRGGIARMLGTDAAGITGIVLGAMERPLPPKEIATPGYYERIDPASIPFPTYFKGDGGPYVTSGIFHASFGHRSNLSFHRMMHIGGGRFAIRVVPRHLHALIGEARKEGEDLPAAVSIGCDIASLIAASCSAPFGTDELSIASAIHKAVAGAPLNTFAPMERGAVRAPAGAEVVLCGRITGESVPEGPFVDITGTYDHSGMEGQPVFVADMALARTDPILHVLLPGGLEHYHLMGLPKEPAILQSVRKVVPVVKAVRLTEGGCCWLHGAVSIRKQKEGDGKNAIMAAFTGHPSMKRVVVVDEDIDVFDDRALEWAIATRFQASNDLVVIEGARGSTLDPSLDEDGTTSKYGMDATMPLSGNEGYRKVEV